MNRGVKPAKAKVEARDPAGRKPVATHDAQVRALEARLAEALEQQAATSEILRVISASPSAVKPVLDAVAERAARLCKAPFARVLLVDGDVLNAVADFSVGGETPIPVIPIALKRSSISGRAVLDGDIVHLADILPLLDTEFPDARDNAHRTGFRAALAVPLVREAGAYGAIFLWRREPGLFAPDQVALVQTFAQQAAIAIENVRLFKEVNARNGDLAETLEQQEATSEILSAIASSPTDIQPVLETVVRAAARFCGAPDVALLRVDGNVLRGAAAVGAFGEMLIHRSGGIETLEIPLTRQSVSGRAAVDRRSVHVHDLAAESEDEYPVGRELQRRLGHRTMLAMPLLREGATVGVIVLFRTEVKPFSEKQVELLRTFADQAVIAIENVRLFTELGARNHDLTEALEQQTATSEILRVISQSQTDVQPVFDTIAAAAHKLCGANSANVFTFDGKLVHLAALVNAEPEYVDALRRFFPRAPGRDVAVTRAIQSSNIVAIPDVEKDTEYTMRANRTTGGFRSVLAIPLLREESAIGAIAVGRADPGPFPDNQIALLQTFADQAVIAIENVRLFKELEARTTQLTRSVEELKALSEVGQAVSSTLDLATVLSTIVSRATKLAGMDGGAIYEYDEARGEFHLQTTDRLPAELVDALRAAPMRKGEGAIGKLAVTGEPVEIRDIADEGAYQSRIRKILVRLGYRSLLAVPLLREDHLLGGLVVCRKSTGAFAPQVIDLLKTFATQSALAIQNARLFREIEDTGRQLRIASQHKSEFLANMSHELRTPLNAIIGFSEVLVERMFGEINDKQAEYLADILESGRHLLSLINDILDLSKIEAGRMELDLADFDLPGAIDNTMTLVRERAHRRGVTLGRTIDERVGKIRGDERKVKQVLLNLLSNALKFTPEGGRIDVRADARGDMVEISVTDTGVGIAPEDLDAVFEEFRQVGSAVKKVEGTGLGLAISRKFIELHGGKIRATSQVGIGSTFAFTLPLTTPQRHSSD
jgi:signal transduction histidine kinase/putative methionine-R-sulfoxide reductase with GAF domain